MTRRPPSRPALLRRLAAVAASAAVLLASFDDELHVAVTTAGAGESAQAAPRPEHGHKAQLFPDLSRQRGDRGESAVVDLAALPTQHLPRESGPAPPRRPGETPPHGAGSGPPLRVLLCVWRV